MVSTKRKLVALGLIVAILSTGSLIYSKGQEDTVDNNTPPTFDIQISRSRLIGQAGDDVNCAIPGYRFTDNEFDNFTPPAGVPQGEKYSLARGVSIFHADEAMTVSQVKNMIVPDNENKVMIVHYNPVNNPNKKFSIWPALNSDQVLPINDPAAYSIPANNGIIIVSCKDTEIWKVKPDTLQGDGMPGNIHQVQNNWVMISASSDLNLGAYNVTAIYPQAGAGFNFPNSVSADNIELNGRFMVWLKIEDDLREDPQPGDDGDGSGAEPTPVNLTCRTHGVDFADDDDSIETGSFNAYSSEFEAMRVGNWTWRWDFGDGTVVNENRVPMTHAYQAPGTYDVTVSVTGPDGRTGSSTCENVEIQERDPVAVPLNVSCTVNGVRFVSANDRFQTAFFTASITEDRSLFGEGKFDMRWNFGDGTPVISDVTPPTSHKYVRAGKFDVTITLTTVNGRSGTATCRNVNISEAEEADAAAGGAAGAGAAGAGAAGSGIYQFGDNPVKDGAGKFGENNDKDGQYMLMQDDDNQGYKYNVEEPLDINYFEDKFGNPKDGDFPEPEPKPDPVADYDVYGGGGESYLDVVINKAQLDGAQYEYEQMDRSYDGAVDQYQGYDRDNGAIEKFEMQGAF